MERLTQRYGDNGVELVNDTIDAPGVAETIAMHRLADYEDTGLTPAEIAELKERQRWIPMSERLPNATDGDYFGMILVCWDGRKSEPTEPKLHSCIETVTVGKMLELYRSGQWNVTHWMPLPEPPKEETR
ncbi:DUF551 domain-containing protein [Ethanoligenens sp.]|uniref:DUF551 domain-containing protein n=1 Tax=Ethanoligenens sp. TaxID=2099655 RepID=UPI0039E80703